MKEPTDKQLESAYGLCTSGNCPSINIATECIAKCLTGKCQEWKKYKPTGEPI